MRSKLLRIFLPSIFLVILFAGEALALVYNLEKRYILDGRVIFGYEKITREKNGAFVTELSEFKERYKLRLKGFVWDPRFISFVGKVNLEKVANESNGGSKSESKVTLYSLYGTLLPRKRIPLDFSFNRSTDGDMTHDAYNLVWYWKTRRFPRTRLFFNTKYTDGEKTGTGYGVAMFKRLWDTDFGFSSATSQDNTNDTENNVKSFYFWKLKDLSADTKLILDGNYSLSKEDGKEVTDKKKSSDLTFTAKLHVKPSDRFSHLYYYRFSGHKRDRFESETGKKEDVTARHSFVARTRYRITDKLALSGRGGFGFSKKRSTDTRTLAKNMYLGTGLSYSVTSRLSTNVSASYGRSITKSESEDSSESSDDETYSFSAGLNYRYDYRKSLGWADFSAGYGLSVSWVNDNDPNDDSGFTIGNTFGSSLSDIDIMGMKRYVTSGVMYTFSRTDSYSEQGDKTHHLFQANANSKFFKRTRIKAKLKHEKTKQFPLTEAQKETNISLDINHYRILYNGRLDLFFKHLRNFYDSGNYTSTQYITKYRRLLTYRTKLTLELKRETNTNNSGNRSTSDSFSVELLHQLRAWLLSMKYLSSYRKGSGSSNVYKENRLMLQATRTFAREF